MRQTNVQIAVSLCYRKHKQHVFFSRALNKPTILQVRNVKTEKLHILWYGISFKLILNFRTTPIYLKRPDGNNDVNLKIVFLCLCMVLVEIINFVKD